MTYPILPLNLQQLWQDQSDRITRLELAYNGPQVSADAASTLATSASASAAAASAAAVAALLPLPRLAACLWRCWAYLRYGVYW